MDSLQRLIAEDAVNRLVRHDPSLFSDEIQLRQPITNRLGWTDLAERAYSRIPLVETLARAIVEEGATDVVLLGMGGSSLAALVMERIIGGRSDMPRLHVLDTTAPSAVMRLLETLERSTTYFLVSSKSGSTVEPLSLYAIFRSWMNEKLEHPESGKHFIAITDPGSPLEALRKKEVMRLTIAAPPNVGGRFSALSVFGLAPAAMIGIDLRELMGRARAMEIACARPAEENPGAKLAAWIADAHAAGRDKLTLVSTPQYAPFGLWVEQLVAESTGKNGIGVVPIIESVSGVPVGYGDDRAVVVLCAEGDTDMSAVATALEKQGHPVIELRITDPLSIGAEFVRWEYAVALLGHLLNINPFDEPNVSEAKEATSKVLAGSIAPPRSVTDLDGVWPSYAGALAGANAPTDLETVFAPIVASVRPGDYLTVLGYLPDSDEHLGSLRHALSRISATTTIATSLALGPRYLHSTGQLHKGGPDTGAFIVITARDRHDISIPGSTFSLGALYRAQAEGDIVTLSAHNRRVMRLDLPDSNPRTIGRVSAAMIAAFR